jgi:hypothetical protein
VKFPSPDAFFYYAKAPVAQQTAVIKWSMEPVSFLTPFQRNLVGYKSFPNEDEMWNRIAQQDIQVQQILQNIPSGSRQYDALKQWGKQMDQAIAAQYGQDGINAYQLSTAAPYVRLRALGVFKDDPVMQQAFQFADLVNARLAQLGLSPLGNSSPTTVALKQWFYSWLAAQTDEKFLRDMDQLSLATSNGVHGGLLYEAVFFGQYQPAFVPPSITVPAAGAGA